MKKTFATLAVAGLLTGGAVTAASAGPPSAACWGQASRVFAQLEPGMMGRHSSEQANPRSGLRNLARTLADAGIIPDDSMSSLGVFVTTELGLSIDACM